MTDRLIREAMRVLDRYAAVMPSSPDLATVRAALDEHMFEGNSESRDDVVAVCQKIDDVLSARPEDREP